MELDNIPTASGWHRFEACPGSFKLIAEARRLGQAAYQDSPEAASGTRIHAALAGEEVELSLEEQRSVELLRERAFGEVKRIFGVEGGTLHSAVEKRLYSPKSDFSGRVDLLWWDEQTALVQDFKSGFHEPEPAESSAQLKVLSVLVGLELPHVKEVIAQIVSGPYGVTETRFGIAELAHVYGEIGRTLEAIGSQEAFYNPGPKQCRYCPGALICPALREKRKLVRLENLPPAGEEAAKLLLACELASRQIEQIRAYYKELLLSQADAEIPGWGLVTGPGRREVADWRAARTRLEEFVSADEIEKLADYSIPKLEKLLVKALGVSPSKAGGKLAEILGSELKFKQGNLVLKRIE